MLVPVRELISPMSFPGAGAIKGMRTVIVEAFPQERDKDSEIYLLYNTARRGIGGREQPKGRRRKFMYERGRIRRV